VKIVEAAWGTATIELNSEDCAFLGRYLALAGDVCDERAGDFTNAEVALCYAFGAALEAAGALAATASLIPGRTDGYKEFGLAFIRSQIEHDMRLREEWSVKSSAADEVQR